MVKPPKMFNYSARLIKEVARKPRPIVPGMAKWFDYCDRVAPECKSLWQRLRRLDFEKDADDLTKWLKRLFAKEPPPREINGLWFGLHNPVLKNKKPTCQMYVGGSSAFDPDSDSNEWVCELSYLPKGRYAKSQVLTDLYRRVEGIIKNNVS